MKKLKILFAAAAVILSSSLLISCKTGNGTGNGSETGNENESGNGNENNGGENGTEVDVLNVSIAEGTDLSAVKESKFQFKITEVSFSAGDKVSFYFIPEKTSNKVTFRGPNSNEKWFDSAVLPTKTGDSVKGASDSNVITKVDDKWYKAEFVPTKADTALGLTFYIPSVPTGSETASVALITVNGKTVAKNSLSAGSYYDYPPGIQGKFTTGKINTSVENNVTEENKICAAYIATWGVYDPSTGKNRRWTESDIDGDKLTDLILSFAEVNDEDHISLDTEDVEDYYPVVKKLLNKYPNLRVSVAIGGASDGVNDFKIMVSDTEKRAAFVDNVKALLEGNTDIHGIDIDWEYPGKGFGSNQTAERAEEFDNYISLMSELKTMMTNLGKTNGIAYRLTTALPADNRYIMQNSSRIQEVCDGLNLMMYDYKGSWSHETGHNAPLNEIEADINTYISNGASPEKIILGIPFYGQRWDEVEEENGNHGLGSALTKTYKDCGIEYTKITPLLDDPAYVKYWDESAKSPYLYNASDKIFISYTDADAISYSTKMARDLKLGGVMTWEYGQDMTGTLLSAMYEGINK